MARFADPVQALRNRIADLPRLLGLQASMRNALLSTPSIVDQVQAGECVVTMCEYRDCEVVAYTVQIETDEGDCAVVTRTTNLARAQSFRDRLVTLNNPAPQPVEPVQGMHAR